MEEKIKLIYSELTGGKSILNNNSLISIRHFNSISGDRFMSELKTLGIKWEGNDTTLYDLLNNVNVQPIHNDDVIPVSHKTENKLFFIGIDIQEISELPIVSDYWESEFYKSKFTPSEIAYATSKDLPLQTFAGLYSCKEAIIKSDNYIKWEEINITHGSNGNPIFSNYSISISHSNNYAVAICFKNLNIFNEIENPDSKKEKITTDFKILFFTFLTLVSILFFIYIIYLFQK